MIIDIHAHYSALKRYSEFSDNSIAHPVLFSAHSPEEIDDLKIRLNSFIYMAAAVHPQEPRKDYFEAVTRAAAEGLLTAVGETGFDLYPSYQANEKEQQWLFEAHIELARCHDLPLVIHCRKALHRIFAYTADLKKLKAVIFHNYTGSVTEAQSFLKKGVNAFFSLGKPLLWGAKQMNKVLQQLDPEHLFLETDAPWQPQRHQLYTPLEDIVTLYDYAAHQRGCDRIILENKLYQSFLRLVRKE